MFIDICIDICMDMCIDMHGTFGTASPAYPTVMLAPRCCTAASATLLVPLYSCIAQWPFLAVSPSGLTIASRLFVMLPFDHQSPQWRCQPYCDALLCSLAMVACSGCCDDHVPFGVRSNGMLQQRQRLPTRWTLRCHPGPNSAVAACLNRLLRY